MLKVPHLSRCETRFLRLYPAPPVVPGTRAHIHTYNSVGFNPAVAAASAAAARNVLRPRRIVTPCSNLAPAIAPSFVTTLDSNMARIQKREHAGHAHHGHGHGHDSAYLVSSNRNDAGVRITRIGLFVNLAMAVGKGVGGYVFHSQALIADGFHALTDLVSDFMTLATISWSLRPPSDRFPTGYGKVESLGALGVSGLLLFGGIGMGVNGLDTLYTQFFADHAHEAHEHSHGLFGFLGHGHSHGPTVPSLNAAWLAAGSIVVKEWLYRASKSNTHMAVRVFGANTITPAMKIAKERKSSVLASNAIHHRIDSLTSIVALLTIGGAHVISDATWLDPVGGIIIAGMVIKAGWGNTRSALLELGDVTIDDEVKEKVERAAYKALRGDTKKKIVAVENGNEVEIRDVQGVKSGQNYLIDVDLVAPSTFTLQQLNAIEYAVRTRIGAKVRGARRVRIKFVSSEASNGTLITDFIPADVSPRSSPEPEPEDEHEHVHTNGHAHSHCHEHKKHR